MTDSHWINQDARYEVFTAVKFRGLPDCNAV